MRWPVFIGARGVGSRWESRLIAALAAGLGCSWRGGTCPRRRRTPILTAAQTECRRTHGSHTTFFPDILRPSIGGPTAARAPGDRFGRHDPKPIDRWIPEVETRKAESSPGP
jgi:hypothetical protein